MPVARTLQQWSKKNVMFMINTYRFLVDLYIDNDKAPMTFSVSAERRRLQRKMISTRVLQVTTCKLPVYQYLSAFNLRKRPIVLTFLLSWGVWRRWPEELAKFPCEPVVDDPAYDNKEILSDKWRALSELMETHSVISYSSWTESWKCYREPPKKLDHVQLQ